MLFAAMCVIWGIPYLLIRVAVRDLSPAALVLARTVIAAVILLPLAARRDELRPLVRHWLPLVVFAVIEIAIPWVMLGTAEQHLSSSLTGLLIAATPLVAVAVAAMTRDREHLTGARAAGLLLGVLGVAAIVGVNPTAQAQCPSSRSGRRRPLRGRPPILQRYLALPSMGVIAASPGPHGSPVPPNRSVQRPERMPSAAAVGAVVDSRSSARRSFVVSSRSSANSARARHQITYVNPAVAAILGVVVLDGTTPGVTSASPSCWPDPCLPRAGRRTGARPGLSPSETAALAAMVRLRAADAEEAVFLAVREWRSRIARRGARSKRPRAPVRVRVLGARLVLRACRAGPDVRR